MRYLQIAVLVLVLWAVAAVAESLTATTCYDSSGVVVSCDSSQARWAVEGGRLSTSTSSVMGRCDADETLVMPAGGSQPMCAKTSTLHPAEYK